MRPAAIALIMCGVCAPAMAAQEVTYGPAPAWLMPALAPVAPDRRQGAIAVLARDVQIRLDAEGQHMHEATEYLVQTAEGLGVGNLQVVWNPAAVGPTVHAVQIIRDGEVIDVLAQERFRIFQREGGLEQAFLDGLLTASLQVPGLRVGDRLRFDLTSHVKDPTFGDQPFGLIAMPTVPSAGSYRSALIWDDGHAPRWMATTDIAGQVQQDGAGIVLRLDQPGQYSPPDGAPMRFMPARMIEYSAFADWQDVSARVYPLFAERAVLPEGSELAGDAERIMRNYATEGERARAALRLMQDQVRYVFVGLDGGNYTPASVADTWERRYGDCKAKTVMLMALLHAMGISAEAVLVNQSAGASDLLAHFLPSPGQFDHVLVRADVDGRQVWLDGTRHGDTRLFEVPPDGIRQFLPLRAAGADLETLPYQPPAEPLNITLREYDATAGIDELSRLRLRQIFRGAEALQMRAGLEALPPDMLDQVLRRVASSEAQWQELEQVDWSFDEDRAALVVTSEGLDDLEWEEADDYAITRFAIPMAGLNPPARRQRPPQQDRTLPYANAPLAFTCYVTTVRLPATSGRQSWTHSADAMNVEIGGVAFWRMADLTGGEVRTVMSRRTMHDEITASEADAANAAIPGFDNSRSFASLRRNPQSESQRQIAAPGITRVPAAGEVDWLADASACRAP